MKTKILGLLAVGLLAGPMTAVSAATVNFANRGDFSAASLYESGLQITAESSLGVAGNLYFLNFNGLGVVGGFDASLIDGTERVLFRADTGYSLTGITLHQNTLVNSDSDQLLGEALVEGFLGATSLGTRSICCSFDVDISSLFGGQTLTGFSVRPNPDALRLYSLDFTLGTLSTVPEPGTLALLGLGLAGLGLSRRRKAA